jgi:glycosyltransferase involved in cell wall biosynthesis
VGRFVEHMPEREFVVVCGLEPGVAATPVPAGVVAYRIAWSRPAVLIRRARRVLMGPRRMPTDAYEPWVRRAVRFVVRHRLLSDTDVLVTFGQPMSDHVAGLHLARRTGCAWVAHFSDPWIDNPFEDRSERARRRGRRLESAVLERADRIVFTSVETARLVMAAHPDIDHGKVRVLPHALDLALYPARDPIPPDRAGPLVLRHVGSFYGRRTPAPLIAALSESLREDPTLADRLSVELVGAAPGVLDAVGAGALPPDLVRVIPPVGYVDSLALMTSADLLVVVDAPARESVFLPSKLIDYLGSGRPVLALTPPGPARAVVAEDGGWYADPEDASACAKALRAAVAAVSADRTRTWGNTALRSSFEADEVAGRLSVVLDDAVDRATARRTGVAR